MSPYETAVRLDLDDGRSAWVSVRNRTGSPRCVLLHGNPGSMSDWSALIGPLAQRFAVAAIDLPGFGRSPHPGGDATSMDLDHMAADVLAVARALGWTEPFFVIGHSHGGGVAQTLAANAPDAVAGIALLGSLGSPPHSSYRLLALPGLARLMRSVAPLLRSSRLRAAWLTVFRAATRDIFHPRLPSAEMVELELKSIAERPHILLSMVQVTRGNPCEKLARNASRIRCPTLFLHGAEDALVPARHPRAIHEEMLRAGADSTFRLVPEAGHMFLKFRAEEVAETLIHFIDGAS